MTGAIATTITQIRQTIPDGVRLIAISKQVSTPAMRAAYAAGIRDFGESRLQEALPKQIELADLTDITWHFIGHLQGNKAARAIAQFQWIHSVDSLRLAQRLNQLAAEQGVQPQVCLQVKIVPDPGKFGWSIAELVADLPILNQCQNLAIAGLMVIPPYGLPREETRAIFEQAKQLADQIEQQGWDHIKMHQLSMGMSDDYPLAIAAGSTMVRLGRILFGER